MLQVCGPVFGYKNERIVDLVEAGNDWVHSALALLCAKFRPILVGHRVPEGGEACIEGSHREDVPVARPDLYYHHNTAFIAIISPYSPLSSLSCTNAQAKKAGRSSEMSPQKDCTALPHKN